MEKTLVPVPVWVMVSICAVRQPYTTIDNLLSYSSSFIREAGSNVTIKACFKNIPYFIITGICYLGCCVAPREYTEIHGRDKEDSWKTLHSHSYDQAHVIRK